MTKHPHNQCLRCIQVRNVILYFSFLLLINSCKSSDPNIEPAKSDSVAIQLPGPTALSPGEKETISKACNDFYDSILKNSNFNGGFLVAKNGNIIFEQYKGTRIPNSQDSINENTPLHIASVTKTFTGMAILKLMEENQLSLNDTLTKFFPSFNYPDVTVQSLLNHRSGLPNYLYFMEDLGWNEDSYITNEDVLNYMITYKGEIKNIGKPDRSFNYCNTNYVLLALIIEKVSGKTYQEYLKEVFFDPLGMQNTFVFELKDTARIPPSYDWRGTEIPYNFLDQSYGDKNIYSTPRDLLTWDRALKENIIFSSATLEKAYTAYSNEKPGVKNYGLGWRMNLYPTGKKMIFHNGWWHGNNSVFIRLIEENATIIALGNRYTNAVYKTRHLANVFNNYFGNGLDDNGEE